MPFDGLFPGNLPPFDPAAWSSFVGPLYPVVLVTIDGQPMSGPMLSRLIQVSLSLHEGGQADTVDLELNAGPLEPGGPLLAVPRKKALIEVWMGYRETGVQYMGSYHAGTATLDCLPYKIKVQGKSANMRKGLKQHRNRNWRDKKFGDIANEIAGENGLEAQVAPRIAATMEKWWGQENESSLHFLQRQAERMNGMFSVKAGKLIIADRDEGETAGGTALGVLVITRPQVIRSTLQVQFGERDGHGKVRGRYRDPDTGEEGHVDEDVGDDDPEATDTYALRHPYANRDEAKRAAAAKAQSLKREADSTSVTIEGTPYIGGGQPMVYDGIHPDIDGLEWIISTAQLSYSKRMGFRAGIQAKTSTKGGGGKGKHKGPKIVGARPQTSMSRGR